MCRACLCRAWAQQVPGKSQRPAQIPLCCEAPGGPRVLQLHTSASRWRPAAPGVSSSPRTEQREDPIAAGKERPCRRGCAQHGRKPFPLCHAAHLGLSVVLTAFLSFPGRSAFVLPSGRESQYLGSKRKFLGEFLMMPAPHTEALGWLVNVMDSNLELYLPSLLLVEAIYAICSTSQSSTRDLGTDEHDKKTKQTNRQKLRL